MTPFIEYQLMRLLYFRSGLLVVDVEEYNSAILKSSLGEIAQLIFFLLTVLETISDLSSLHRLRPTCESIKILISLFK